MNKLKVLELFAGIGACSKALEKLGIEHEIVDAVEIDKYAVKSFNAIHNTNFEPQDITQWDKDIQVDLVMHGSPCQDFSLAGLQAGGDEGSGTRSSLMYETLRIVEKLKPKYVIWENVKNVISKKHKHNYDNYCNRMSELGYISYGQVLNSKDYGIPQNRERVFTISIRKDLNQTFEFPQKQELKLKLKDMLEDEVDEKYYLSDKMIKYISADNDKWTGNNKESLINKSIASTINTGEGSRRCDASNYVSNRVEENFNLKRPEKVIKHLIETNQIEELPCCCDSTINEPNNYDLIQIGQLYGTEKEPNPQDGRIYDADGLIPTLDTQHIPKMAIKNATKKGYLEATDGDGIDLAQPNSKTRRGRVQKDSVQTLTTQNNLGVCVIGNYMPSGHEASRIVYNEGIAPTIKENHGTVTATNEPRVLGGIGEKKSNGGTQWYQQDRIYDNNVGLSLSTTAQPYYPDNQLRIRKLTPKECWRLMGFDDMDFEKASQVCSNAQLYKQAGNSIVVNVLMAIFKQLLESEVKEK